MVGDGLFMGLQGATNYKHHVEELACAGEFFQKMLIYLLKHFYKVHISETVI